MLPLKLRVRSHQTQRTGAKLPCRPLLLFDENYLRFLRRLLPCCVPFAGCAVSPDAGEGVAVPGRVILPLLEGVITVLADVRAGALLAAPGMYWRARCLLV